MDTCQAIIMDKFCSLALLLAADLQLLREPGDADALKEFCAWGFKVTSSAAQTEGEAVARWQ